MMENFETLKERHHDRTTFPVSLFSLSVHMPVRVRPFPQLRGN